MEFVLLCFACFVFWGGGQRLGACASAFGFCFVGSALMDRCPVVCDRAPARSLIRMKELLPRREGGSRCTKDNQQVLRHIMWQAKRRRSTHTTTMLASPCGRRTARPHRGRVGTGRKNGAAPLVPNGGQSGGRASFFKWDVGWCMEADGTWLVHRLPPSVFASTE